MHGQTASVKGGEVTADIAGDTLRAALSELHKEKSLDWARKLVNIMKERAGLLIPIREDVYCFPHPTFQEYLAGCYLGELNNFAKEALFDPANMLSPGVIINNDPQAHIMHLKSIPLVSAEVDKCIECGFCEPKCPSRSLTLTPRQRIVAQRELAQMRLNGSISAEADSISREFSYAGLDTCALDGLCATACPVNINTADLTRRLRIESVTPRGEAMANWIANHFAFSETMLGLAIRLGHFGESVIGAKNVSAAIQVAEKLTGTPLPKWNAHVNRPTKNLRTLQNFSTEREYLYFPSCVSRQLGMSKPGGTPSLAETFITIAERAGINLSIPHDVSAHCCGMPFHSKGYTQAYRLALHKTLLHMWEWSEHGKYPIVMDTTSCTHTLRTCRDDLQAEDQDIWKKLVILDGIEFLHDIILAKLDVHPVDQDVVLHPNCSARKLGLDAKLHAIAKQCARSASVPLHLGLLRLRRRPRPALPWADRLRHTE